MKNDTSPDKHVKIMKHARILGNGCSKHCNCRWCKENRLYKFVHKQPVDEYGKILK